MSGRTRSVSPTSRTSCTRLPRCPPTTQRWSMWRPSYGRLSSPGTPRFTTRPGCPLRSAVRRTVTRAATTLVDDFVRAVVDGTLPPVNAWKAARSTLPGIVAHESARRGGERLPVLTSASLPMVALTGDRTWSRVRVGLTTFRQANRHPTSSLRAARPRPRCC